MADRRSGHLGRLSYNGNRPPYYGRGDFQSTQGEEFFKRKGFRSNEVRQSQLQAQNLRHPSPSEHFDGYTNTNLARSDFPHVANKEYGKRGQVTDGYQPRQTLLTSNSPAYFNKSSTTTSLTVSNTSNGQLNANSQHTAFLPPNSFQGSSQGNIPRSNQHFINNQAAGFRPPQYAVTRPGAHRNLPINLAQNLINRPGAPQHLQSGEVQLSNSSDIQLPLWQPTSTVLPTNPQLLGPMTSPNLLSPISDIHRKPPHVQQALSGIPPPQVPSVVTLQNCDPNMVALVPPSQPQHSVLPPGNHLLNRDIKNISTPRAGVTTGGPSTLKSFEAGKPEQIDQKSKDLEWINRFLLERQPVKEKQESKIPQQDMKIHEAKKLLLEWNQLLEDLSKLNSKMNTMEMVGVDKAVLHQELEKANALRSLSELMVELMQQGLPFEGRVVQLQVKFSSPTVLEQLKHKLERRKKKRAWWRRMRSYQNSHKTESEKNRIQLHRKIDEWREKVIASDQAKLRAQAMKSEAGGALGEVRRKLVEANKARESLKALKKLRDVRQQEARVQGVYALPTDEANKRFTQKINYLEKLVTKQQHVYETEERTLKVMMAEEEEERDKETRKKFRHEMQQHGQTEAVKQYDPMDEFRRFYNQAEFSLGSLLHVRRQWDAYIVPEVVAGASRIPDGWVTPAEPSSSLWESALQEKFDDSPKPS